MQREKQLEQNEEWVGLYFRLPKGLRDEFKEAVARTYGTHKGAMGEALRDLIEDFISMVHNAKYQRKPKKTLWHVFDKLVESDFGYDYTKLQSKAWGVYEDMLKAIWTKTAHYPRFPIPKADFEEIISGIRGKSKTTIYRWTKSLKEAGLIEDLKTKVKIRYPLISNITNVEDMQKEDLFKYFMFAIISPDNTTTRLIYAVPVKMNPPHEAIFIVRIENGEIALEHKDFIPAAFWHELLNAIDEKKPIKAKGAPAIIQALILKEGYNVVSLYGIDVVHNILSASVDMHVASMLLGAPTL